MNAARLCLAGLMVAGCAVLPVPATALARHGVQIVVPVNVDGLPPEVRNIAVSCGVNQHITDPTTMPVGYWRGQGRTEIPVLNGQFHGRVRVEVLVTHDTPSHSPYAELAQFNCAMDFIYDCAGPEGTGLCEDRNSSKGTAFGESATGHAAVWEVSEPIDYSTATEIGAYVW